MKLTHHLADSILTIDLTGKVDATTAPAIEEESKSLLKRLSCTSLSLDCEKLDYLSSAGIRTILRLAHLVKHIELKNVQASVYAVLDMTGLTEMINISQAYRRVSVEGCPIIGRGAKGAVYRIDPETICKVHYNPNDLPDIDHEREVSRTAFVAGIPTAIPYDVVRVGDGYGLVFELLDTKSLADLLSAGEMSVEEAARISTDLLRQLASTETNSEVIPSFLETETEWIDTLKPILPASTIDRIYRIIDQIPPSKTLIHGDLHIQNIMMQDGEPLLIDMDTLSYGNTLYDFEAIYEAYVGFGLIDPRKVEGFLGIPYDMAQQLWDLILHGFYQETDAAEMEKIEDFIHLLSATRLMGQPLRHGRGDTPEGQQAMAFHRRIFEELLPRVEERYLG